MNVLQILPRLQVGGVERGVVDFSRYLIEKGHKSVVISAGGRLVEELVSDGAVHYSLPVDKKSLISVLSCIKKIKKIILREKIDIVHSRSRVPDWIGFFASLKTPAQFVVTAHGYYSVHFFSRVVSLAKILIAPGNTIAKHLRDSFKVMYSKIIVIPRGLDITKFGFVSPEKKDFSQIKICFLGRISPIKGLEYFVAAVNHLAKNFDNVIAVIAGETGKGHKDYEVFLRSLISKAGLKEKIRFLGYQGSSSVLNDAHFLVLPSLIPESFGRVIIEAQAKGVVCIASGIGGPAEIIEEGKTGFLVPPLDSKAIAEKIKQVISDRILYEKIVYSARRKVEEVYTLRQMSEKTLESYQKCMGIKNILVIKTSSLGDVVLGTACLKTLRKKFPKACISVLCSRTYFKIMKGLDFIDETIIYEDSRPYLSELFRLSCILRRKSLDILVDLQNNKFSHLLCLFSLSKSSIGFDKRLGFLLDVKVDYKQTRHLNPLQSQKRILEKLGVEDMELPELRIDSSSQKQINAVLDKKGVAQGEVLVGINLQASFKWKTKNLNYARLKQLIQYILEEKKVKVILVGQERSYSKAKNIEGFFSGKVINLCGQTDLLGLVSVISRTELFITQDSAPFHISSSLGVNTIGIFGPTDPASHAVKRKNVFILSRSDLNCLGCYKKKCSSSTCMDIKPEKFSRIIDMVLQ